MKHNTHSQADNHKPAGAVTSEAVDYDQNDAAFVTSPDEVARRAYFTYVNEGSPAGRDVQHWLAAEAELIAERNQTRNHWVHHQT